MVLKIHTFPNHFSMSKPLKLTYSNLEFNFGGQPLETPARSGNWELRKRKCGKGKGRRRGWSERKGRGWKGRVGRETPAQTKIYNDTICSAKTDFRTWSSHRVVQTQKKLSSLSGFRPRPPKQGVYFWIPLGALPQIGVISLPFACSPIMALHHLCKATPFLSPVLFYTIPILRVFAKPEWPRRFLLNSGKELQLYQFSLRYSPLLSPTFYHQVVFVSF